MQELECCGQHEVCERDSLMAAAVRDVDYYDDEELDAYRGTSADAYTDAQAEEFRYVLTTMRTNEVGGWLRSLQLRGVELPQQVRDEALMLLSE